MKITKFRMDEKVLFLRLWLDCIDDYCAHKETSSMETDKRTKETISGHSTFLFSIWWCQPVILS